MTKIKDVFTGRVACLFFKRVRQMTWADIGKGGEFFNRYLSCKILVNVRDSNAD